jgi:hypothetical protein
MTLALVGKPQNVLLLRLATMPQGCKALVKPSLAQWALQVQKSTLRESAALTKFKPKLHRVVPKKWALLSLTKTWTPLAKGLTTLVV